MKEKKLKGKRAVTGERPQEEAGKKAKLTSLKEQEAWLRQLEKLTKQKEKLKEKLGKVGGQTQKRMDKLAAVQVRLDEMKAIEQQIAAASCPSPALTSRKSFSLKKTPTSGIAKGGFDTDECRRAERRLRFSADASSLGSDSGGQVTLQEVRMALMASSPAADDDGEAWDLGGQTVYGTSTALEKPYLRLTSAPAMSTIRPPDVLERALALVKSKWRAAAAKPLARKEAYSAFCEQLKSIRQDLTVQHIRSNLTVSVYETHARVALEVGDMAEYTQCSSCLKRLYLEGLAGNEAEFTSYRLLAAAVLGPQAMSLELLALSARCQALRSQAKPQLCEDPCVGHALEVATAVRTLNFHRFFMLYSCAPRMSAYLMDALLDTVRTSALAALVAAYGREVEAAFVCTELGFDCPEELAEYATPRGVVVDLQRGVLDPKASKLSAVSGPQPRAST
mmetsp:Transcript_33838/g.95800  ORF Transcript_33838/g.95800 Transcript_33838/m.95800 type:complete len:450 (+) Transcript_33838:1149-2498(+)